MFLHHCHRHGNAEALFGWFPGGRCHGNREVGYSPLGAGVPLQVGFPPLAPEEGVPCCHGNEGHEEHPGPQASAV